MCERCQRRVYYQQPQQRQPVQQQRTQQPQQYSGGVNSRGSAQQASQPQYSSYPNGQRASQPQYNSYQNAPMQYRGGQATQEQFQQSALPQAPQQYSSQPIQPQAPNKQPDATGNTGEKPANVEPKSRGLSDETRERFSAPIGEEEKQKRAAKKAAANNTEAAANKPDNKTAVQNNNNAVNKPDSKTPSGENKTAAQNTTPKTQTAQNQTQGSEGNSQQPASKNIFANAKPANTSTPNANAPNTANQTPAQNTAAKSTTEKKNGLSAETRERFSAPIGKEEKEKRAAAKAAANKAAETNDPNLPSYKSVERNSPEGFVGKNRGIEPKPTDFQKGSVKDLASAGGTKPCSDTEAMIRQESGSNENIQKQCYDGSLQQAAEFAAKYGEMKGLDTAVKALETLSFFGFKGLASDSNIAMKALNKGLSEGLKTQNEAQRALKEGIDTISANSPLREAAKENSERNSTYIDQAFKATSDPESVDLLKLPNTITKTSTADGQTKFNTSDANKLRDDFNRDRESGALKNNQELRDKYMKEIINQTDMRNQLELAKAHAAVGAEMPEFKTDAGLQKMMDGIDRINQNRAQTGIIANNMTPERSKELLNDLDKCSNDIERLAALNKYPEISDKMAKTCVSEKVSNGLNSWLGLGNGNKTTANKKDATQENKVNPDLANVVSECQEYNQKAEYQINDRPSSVTHADVEDSNDPAIDGPAIGKIEGTNIYKLKGDGIQMGATTENMRYIDAPNYKGKIEGPKDKAAALADMKQFVQDVNSGKIQKAPSNFAPKQTVAGSKLPPAPANWKPKSEQANTASSDKSNIQQASYNQPSTSTASTNAAATSQSQQQTSASAASGQSQQPANATTANPKPANVSQDVHNNMVSQGYHYIGNNSQGRPVYSKTPVQSAGTAQTPNANSSQPSGVTGAATSQSQQSSANDKTTSMAASTATQNLSQAGQKLVAQGYTYLGKDSNGHERYQPPSNNGLNTRANVTNYRQPQSTTTRASNTYYQQPRYQTNQQVYRRR